MRRRVETAGDLLEFIQDFTSNPDTPVEVIMDGHDFAIDYVELDTDGVIRIHLEV